MCNYFLGFNHIISSVRNRSLCVAQWFRAQTLKIRYTSGYRYSVHKVSREGVKFELSHISLYTKNDSKWKRFVSLYI